MPTIPEYSVVIPTLNEEDTIEHLIIDLNKQTIKPKEIITVDGGSTDKTQQIIKSNPIVSIFTTEPNVGMQRNTGWKKSKTDIIIFLDADTRCSSSFIEESLREFIEKKLDIACPVYEPITKDSRIKKIYKFFNNIFYIAQWSLPSGAGSCIISRKKILQHTKGFHERYKYDDLYFIRSGARFGRFRVLSTTIQVSARRFEVYGVWKTFSLYILLSFYFIFGAHHIANKISYPFAKYKKG